ncbi:MAG: hypothetical protein ACKVQK_23675 [Burkholderiales bacterium]
MTINKRSLHAIQLERMLLTMILGLPVALLAQQPISKPQPESTRAAFEYVQGFRLPGKTGKEAFDAFVAQGFKCELAGVTASKEDMPVQMAKCRRADTGYPGCNPMAIAISLELRNPGLGVVGLQHRLGQTTVTTANLSCGAQAIPPIVPSIQLGDGPIGAGAEGWRILAAVNEGEFTKIEETLKQYASSRERLLDGRWRLNAYVNGMISAIGNDWARSAKIIELWKKAVPMSVGAALFEFRYWTRYAWDARGTGFANSVTREGWALYHERMRKAESALIESKSYASQNPEWYASYIELAGQGGWEREKRWALFREAVAREPYYQAHYFNFVSFAIPRWGGNYEEIAKIADEAVKLTSKQEGVTFYTRVYWSLQGTEGTTADIFRDAGASWPRMKKGFDELIKLNPKSNWILNNYASFACRANDKQTFLALSTQIGTQPYRQAWSSNHSYDVCVRRFTEQA